MATMADDVRIAAAEEATEGTLVTGAYEKMRLNSESVSQQQNSVESAELNAARAQTDEIRAGASVSGSIETYAIMNDTLRLFFKSLLGSNESGETHKLGTYLTTFSLEKQIPRNGTALYDYQRYTGLSVNSCQISMAPNEPITFSWGMIGGGMTLAADSSTGGDAEAGASYTEPDPADADAPPMRADGLTLDWGSELGALDTGVCTGMTIDINSNNREIEQLGTFDGKVGLGKFSARISCTYLFESNLVLDKLISGATTSLDVTLADSMTTPSTWLFDFAKVKIAQATVVTPATGSDVVVEFEAVAIAAAIGSNTLQITSTESN